MEGQNILNLYALFIQTSGILIALISVVALYRIQQIKDYLIGQGKVVYDNMGLYIKRGFKLKGTYYDRLKGAFEVKSIPGIEEIMVRLTNAECELYPELEQRGETGFYKQAMPFWIQTTALMNKIRAQYLRSIILLIAIIVLSVMGLTFIDRFNNTWSVIFFVFISILFLVNLVLVFLVIRKSFMINIAHDRYKMSLINDLRKKFPEVDELYKKFS